MLQNQMRAANEKLEQLELQNLKLKQKLKDYVI
jgi:hypothetical protein